MSDLPTDEVKRGPKPSAEWDDPRVQAAYALLNLDEAPHDPSEHWEGYIARRIVDALFPATDGESPLPEPHWFKTQSFSAEQMHAFRAEGVAIERQKFDDAMYAVGISKGDRDYVLERVAAAIRKAPE